jgi:hypothetical protein
MTHTEAAEKAQEVFGRDGYACDREKQFGVGKYGKLPRYYVGSGATHYGNGDSWEDAFANVRRVKTAVR